MKTEKKGILEAAVGIGVIAVMIGVGYFQYFVS